ncbi:MAG TPA: hypothetical protein PKC39_08880 [Ferruginibacter sp.]|nr:hypothetical protein [Ferruginibacter sp.]HMP21059.1 hypothetical protein [Ferruginibacter sp.]
MKQTLSFLLIAMLATLPFMVAAQNMVEIATGNYHVLAIKNGTLYGWGDNTQGQVGIGTKSVEYAPVQIGAAGEWKQVAAAAMHSLAIKKDGSLWAWGWGNNHELGLGQAKSESLVPARVGKDTNWAMVSTAFYNTVAIKTDGSLWVWGSNVQAGLGVGVTPNSAVYVPTRVGKDNDWLTAVAVQHITLAIKKNGTLWAWGRKGGSDVRGFETMEAVTTAPTQVGTATDWKQLFVHRQHGRAAVIAIKQDGSICAWGHNRSGKLGFGDEQYRPSPTVLQLKGEWQSFAIADDYTLAVSADGSLWHSGSYLQWAETKMGDKNGSLIFQRTKITGKWKSAYFIQMSGVILVSENGDVYGYGINARGELGNGTKKGSWKPGLIRLL